MHFLLFFANTVGLRVFFKASAFVVCVLFSFFRIFKEHPRHPQQSYSSVGTQSSLPVTGRYPVLSSDSLLFVHHYLAFAM